MEETKSPTAWASLGATVNTGNFENTKIDIGVSGIPIDATPEQRAAMMELSKKTLYEVVMTLGEELGKRIQDIKG
jgi:hypothetical protein